jgi:arylsulfatase
MPAEGTLTLHIRNHQVGEGHIRTQPGKFDRTGPGFLLGRSGGEPVADDHPGQSPWRFAGGTVQRLLIDVSGEPFEDLAREAAAAYARQ